MHLSTKRRKQSFSSKRCMVYSQLSFKKLLSTILRIPSAKIYTGKLSSIPLFSTSWSYSQYFYCIRISSRFYLHTLLLSSSEEVVNFFILILVVLRRRALTFSLQLLRLIAVSSSIFVIFALSSTTNLWKMFPYKAPSITRQSFLLLMISARDSLNLMYRTPDRNSRINR